MTASKTHWSRIWSERDAESVGWFQAHPDVSIDLLTAVEPRRDARVLDVGGGGSTLVDGLLELGYQDITVLDIAGAALDQAQKRLGDLAHRVSWVADDITTYQLDDPYDLWHDRAVFHFMTDALDRDRYLDRAKRGVIPGGHLIVATFAADGPERCSGLPVQRYSAESLAAQFAPAFESVTAVDEVHHTPGGDPQHFTYLVLRRSSQPDAP